MSLDTLNKQLVSVRGDRVVVLRPLANMSKEDALVHAAWIVALADDDEEFDTILKVVRET